MFAWIPDRIDSRRAPQVERHWRTADRSMDTAPLHYHCCHPHEKNVSQSAEATSAHLGTVNHVLDALPSALSLPPTQISLFSNILHPAMYDRLYVDTMKKRQSVLLSSRQEIWSKRNSIAVSSPSSSQLTNHHPQCMTQRLCRSVDTLNLFAFVIGWKAML